MASNLIAMASNLIAMASNLEAMASGEQQMYLRGCFLVYLMSVLAFSGMLFLRLDRKIDVRSNRSTDQDQFQQTTHIFTETLDAATCMASQSFASFPWFAAFKVRSSPSAVIT